MREDLIAPGVVALDFDRAPRGNSLTVELVESLLSALPRIADDHDIHTLVLRPRGSHFCTGFDLSDLDRQSDGDLLHRFVRVEQLLNALWHAPLRTVACARGRTWGAGADLFAACDVRAADPGTSFSFPGAQFGLVLGSRRLAERVGVDRARAWITQGANLGAADAVQAGLVTDLVAGGGDEDRWLAALCAPPAVDRATAAAIRAATRGTDRDDGDLAALVRSAATPGLKSRIEGYRARVLAAAQSR